MDNVAIAENYYTAWGEKDVARMEKFLHPNAQLITPLEETVVLGKEAILEKLKKGATFFKTLTIRAKLGSGNQTMLVIDLDFPMGSLRTASHMTFHEGLITRIELFFDTKPKT
ncbi:MAG TPA: nuclear transport factor 2 family protein [Rhabdochlamydiaceae bacterium]|nr:nuclear transport factor 2 family protein [Rhabdochlamydiaceae bacterium]